MTTQYTVSPEDTELYSTVKTEWEQERGNDLKLNRGDLSLCMEERFERVVVIGKLYAEVKYLLNLVRDKKRQVKSATLVTIKSGPDRVTDKVAEAQTEVHPDVIQAVYKEEQVLRLSLEIEERKNALVDLGYTINNLVELQKIETLSTPRV